MSALAGLFALFSVLPLIAVLVYILIKGVSTFNLSLFTQLPPPPGISGGGIGNAIIGSVIVTTIAALIAIPVGVGGGIYLAEYSKGGGFSKFIRFGTNVLAGVPSIIAGVFVYGVIVSTRLLFGHTFSAIAGGTALSVLMLPTVVKTTDEGLKLFQRLKESCFWRWGIPFRHGQSGHPSQSLHSHCYRCGVVHSQSRGRNGAVDFHSIVFTVLANWHLGTNCYVVRFNL